MVPFRATADFKVNFEINVMRISSVMTIVLKLMLLVLT